MSSYHQCFKNFIVIFSAGKIEKTDWNVKEIEKKIAENKTTGRSPRQRAEKVPKWSRQQFDDKVCHCSLATLIMLLVLVISTFCCFCSVFCNGKEA